MEDTRRDATVRLDGVGRNAIVTPGAPEPERSPAGVAMVTLLGTSAAASLQVGVRWWPETAQLGRLVAAAAKARGVDSADVQVRAPDLTGVRAEVVLRNGSTDLVLAAAASSGVPPFTTVLSAQITGEVIEAVRRALFGQRDRLLVRCSGNSPESGCITAYADVSEWTRAAPQTHVVMLVAE